MGSALNAHIFGRRSRGDREEVSIKLFDSGGNPIELEGGGGGGLRKAEVILDHAAILDLPVTFYEVIPPTEILNYNIDPTSIPVFISGHVFMKVAGSTYANLSSEYINALYLIYGSDWSGDCAIAIDSPEADNQTAVITTKSTDMRLVLDGGSNNQQRGFYPLPINHLAFMDNGVYLALATPNTSGALTGGGANDQIKVTVWYEIVEIGGE